MQRLQARWPFVLEDEAQDSSRLQEEMLRLLSNEQNWVRVGDPNQAINTTFTTANPRFLVDFLTQDDVAERPLSVSGRSAAPIVDVANETVRWVSEEHPVVDLRDAFEYQNNSRHGSLRGLIQMAQPDDPQPNPLETAAQLELYYQVEEKITPDRELDQVANDLQHHWQRLEDEGLTVAVLVPENSRGFKLAERLRISGVPYEELLRSTTGTRQAVSLLQKTLDYLCDPANLKKLKTLYWAQMSSPLREQVRGDADLKATLTKVFAQWSNLEAFLWPKGVDNALDVASIAPDFEWLSADIGQFRRLVRRWLEAGSLPIDQLVLTVAHDIFCEPVDIALAHKIAVLLRSLANNHPDWRLPQFVTELRMISENERRFVGFDEVASGYQPKVGLVTIATMHAAKGLEWDRVYLLALSNYGFPSLAPYDNFIGEKWYARGSFDGVVDKLNLQAELLAQLDAALTARSYDEGEATIQARVDYAKERLRLLYVGITRAKRELVLSWNMGRYWNKDFGRANRPALPLVMLGEYVR